MNTTAELRHYIALAIAAMDDADANSARPQLATIDLHTAGAHLTVAGAFADALGVECTAYRAAMDRWRAATDDLMYRRIAEVS